LEIFDFGISGVEFHDLSLTQGKAAHDSNQRGIFKAVKYAHATETALIG
jgi:hypothetical protein